MRCAVLGLIVILAIVPASASVAQTPDPAPVRAGISRLDFMVGRWRGEAWQQRGSERVASQMLEVVERKLDGTILLVEGRGTVTGPTGSEQVVHHALGVISFNPRTNTYSLRSYLATGQSGDFDLVLIDGGVRWTREVPGGRVRNTARFSATEWHEISEFSRDGTTWTPVMEFRLQRIP